MENGTWNSSLALLESELRRRGGGGKEGEEGRGREGGESWEMEGGRRKGEERKEGGS